MKRPIAAVAVALAASAAIGWGIARARARSAGDAPGGPIRQQVDLTIYQNDFAMVSEVRPLAVGTGRSRAMLGAISRALDPDSVILRWQAPSGSRPRIVSHAYDLGVSDESGLLRRYLGQEIQIVRYAGGHEADRQTGTLVGESGGQVVIQSEGRFFVRPPGTVVAPARPNVVALPQLSVELQSPSGGTTPLQIGYLTRGLSWSADYVAPVSPTSDTMDLECWATVVNRTGTDYPNARVALVAGEPNRAVREAQSRAPGPPSSFTLADGSAEPRAYAVAGRLAQGFGGAEPQQAGDTQVYRISAPTTVVPERMNRLLMLSADRVPARKDYSARLPEMSPWEDGFWWPGAARPRRLPIGVSLSFANDERAGLSVPLPHGAIRLYEPDSGGSLRYVGAADIADAPKGARVDLTLGSAFDLYAECRLARRVRVNRHTLRKEVEVTLHNAKAGQCTVRALQGFGGAWRIVSESHAHVKLDARQAQWTLVVPANGQATLRYTVELAD